jgi:hypothetical protein
MHANKRAVAIALSVSMVLGGCSNISLTDSQKVILGGSAAGAAAGAAMGAAYGDAGVGAAAGAGAGLVSSLLYEWLWGGGIP